MRNLFRRALFLREPSQRVQAADDRFGSVEPEPWWAEPLRRSVSDYASRMEASQPSVDQGSSSRLQSIARITGGPHGAIRCSICGPIWPGLLAELSPHNKATTSGRKSEEPVEGEVIIGENWPT